MPISNDFLIIYMVGMSKIIMRTCKINSETARHMMKGGEFSRTNSWMIFQQKTIWNIETDFLMAIRI